MISEFELIRRFFTRPAVSADLGIGDDCALLSVTPGHQLAVSTDMLVSGRHFFADVDPAALGHKCLAVNLSDMAAMGARPRWFTLSLALPEVDEAWLAPFSEGMLTLAEDFGIELVGGDTTRGPLNICVQILGEVPRGAGLLRSGAKVGDDVWVSGTPGDAALALRGLQHRAALSEEALRCVRARLERPVPRVALGLALRGIASAAIDVSDGLLADLGHILERSAVGADLQWVDMPLSDTLRGQADEALVRQCALAGGDDYELCFTAPPAQRGRIAALSGQHGVGVSRIGCITAQRELNVSDASGARIELDSHGFDHFT